MKLPPLNALRAFEAAARHNSFVKAAEEMHVSPGAISRHVRKLEEHLSLTLFERKAQGLMLTEVGAQLLPEITEALQRIAAAALRAQKRSNEIRVLVAPTFGARWLIPRLPQFSQLYPSIRVSLGLSVGDERFSEGAFDVAITQRWWLDASEAETFETRFLRYERLAPVCSSALAKRPPRLRKISDLRHKPMLHALNMQDWQAWLSSVGETCVPVEGGTIYPTGDAAARAAVQGKGVAIVDVDLYEYELDSGQLVVPFDFVVEDASAIVFVCSKGRFGDLSVGLFFDWLESALRRKA